MLREWFAVRTGSRRVDFILPCSWRGYTTLLPNSNIQNPGRRPTDGCALGNTDLYHAGGMVAIIDRKQIHRRERVRWRHFGIAVFRSSNQSFSRIAGPGL